MQLKQKALLVSLFIGITVSATAMFALFDNTTALAAGACGKTAGYNDNCMEQNRSKTPLSPSEFSNAVHSCEGRDSPGANYGDVRYDSQSGNCSNAVASCYEKVIDKRVCTNNTYLADASEYENGDLTSEDWDTTIDDVNRMTGGDDLQTNAGIRGDRERAYDKQIEDSKVCDARGTVGGVDDCKKALKNAFDQCYDSLGGSHGNVQQSALDSCVNEKRRNLAQNKAECEAGGGEWTGGASGPVQPGVTQQAASQPGVTQNCKEKKQTPAPSTTTGGGTKSTGDSGNCGVAGTNLISCTETDSMQVIGYILKLIIQILSIGVGIAAVGGIGYAAVLYASATDNAGQAQNAISIIRNIVIGILVYGFMIAIINWLVPGGVIG